MPPVTPLREVLVETVDASQLMRDCPPLRCIVARGDSMTDLRGPSKTVSPPDSLEEHLLTLCGQSTDSLPSLRAQAASLSDGQWPWLQLELLSLAVMRDRLVALPANADDTDDAADLLAWLLPQLSLAGRLHLTGSFALLAPAKAPEARFSLAARVAGRVVDAFLPEGPRGAEWRRTLTEAQMLLHQHPVNQRRDQHGRRPLNALWISGGAAAVAMPPGISVGTSASDRLHGLFPTSPDPTYVVWRHTLGQPAPAMLRSMLSAPSLRLSVFTPHSVIACSWHAWHRLRIWRRLRLDAASGLTESERV